MTVVHVLYRMFDANQELLYVGLTKDPSARFKQHSQSKDWFLEVAAITVEHFATREELTAAEILAIRSECPRHNIVHNDGDDAERWWSKEFITSVEEEDYEDFLMYTAMAKTAVDEERIGRLTPEQKIELHWQYVNQAAEMCPPDVWRKKYSYKPDGFPETWVLAEYDEESA